MTGAGPAGTPRAERGSGTIGGLSVEGLCHSYGARPVLSNVDFAIGAGEIVALLGPSGSGKTTILRIIAGLLRATAGRILIDGNPIDHVPTDRRDMGLVFQSYALFPHLTVRENIGYGLAARKLPRAELGRRVDDVLALVRLADVADRLPRELSGGQQQRVATGRALATNPRVLLLDEPFAALDRNLRLDLQIEFLGIQRRFGTTTLIVTHDQEEAFSLADRVIVLNDGRIEQIGAPNEIYDRPASLFVNAFVGTTNILDCAVAASDGGTTRVRLASGHELTFHTSVEVGPGTPARLTTRPQYIDLSGTDTGTGALRGRVDAAMSNGPSLMYSVSLEDGTGIKASRLREPHQQTFSPGDDVFVTLTERYCCVFAASASERFDQAIIR